MFSLFLFPIVHCESTETLLMFMLALYSTAWLNLFTRTKRISFLKLFWILWKYHVIWKQRPFNLFLYNLDPFSGWIVAFGTPNTTLSRKYKSGTLVSDLRQKVFCFCSLLLSSVGPLNMSLLPEHCLWSVSWLWLFRVPTWSRLYSDIVHVSRMVLALKKLIMLKFLPLKA